NVVLKVETIKTVAVGSLTDCLKEYFKPLIAYQRGDAYSQEQLCQPLWLFRKEELECKRTLQSIHILAKSIGVEDKERLLAQCIEASFPKTTGAYGGLSKL